MISSKSKVFPIKVDGIVETEGTVEFEGIDKMEGISIFQSKLKRKIFQSMSNWKPVKSKSKPVPQVET